MTFKPKTDIKETITELWLKGLTYAEIARHVGVSRQRVQQIVRPPKAVYDLVLGRAGGKCEDCGVPLTSGHVHHANHETENFNEVEFLMYLCPGCHAGRHGKVGNGGCGRCGKRLAERWINGWGFTRCTGCKWVEPGSPKRQNQWDKKSEQKEIEKRNRKRLTKSVTAGDKLCR